jgi:hypothetical protein
VNIVQRYASKEERMTNVNATPTPQITSNRRARRSATAVIAQYIKDLTQPSEPAQCPAAA